MLTQAARLNVSQTVENRKRGAVLKDTYAVVAGRRLGCYVVLVGEANFIQLRTPLEVGGFFRLASRSYIVKYSCAIRSAVKRCSKCLLIFLRSSRSIFFTASMAPARS